MNNCKFYIKNSNHDIFKDKIPFNNRKEYIEVDALNFKDITNSFTNFKGISVSTPKIFKNIENYNYESNYKEIESYLRDVSYLENIKNIFGSDKQFCSDEKNYPNYKKMITLNDDITDYNAFLLLMKSMTSSASYNFYNKDDNRCIKNVGGIYYLMLDFDDGTTLDDIKKSKLSAYNFILITSSNHLKDKNDGKGKQERFHVFLPFRKKIALKADLFRPYRHDTRKYSLNIPEHFNKNNQVAILNFIAEEYNLKIDKQCKDISRLSYSSLSDNMEVVVNCTSEIYIDDLFEASLLYKSETTKKEIYKKMHLDKMDFDKPIKVVNKDFKFSKNKIIDKNELKDFYKTYLNYITIDDSTSINGYYHKEVDAEGNTNVIFSTLKYKNVSNIKINKKHKSNNLFNDSFEYINESTGEIESINNVFITIFENTENKFLYSICKNLLELNKKKRFMGSLHHNRKLSSFYLKEALLSITDYKNITKVNNLIKNFLDSQFISHHQKDGDFDIIVLKPSCEFLISEEVLGYEKIYRSFNLNVKFNNIKPSDFQKELIKYYYSRPSYEDFKDYRFTTQQYISNIVGCSTEQVQYCCKGLPKAYILNTQENNIEKGKIKNHTISIEKCSPNNKSYFINLSVNGSLLIPNKKYYEFTFKFKGKRKNISKRFLKDSYKKDFMKKDLCEFIKMDENLISADINTDIPNFPNTKETHIFVKNNDVKGAIFIHKEELTMLSESTYIFISSKLSNKNIKIYSTDINNKVLKSTEIYYLKKYYNDFYKDGKNLINNYNKSLSNNIIDLNIEKSQSLNKVPINHKQYVNIFNSITNTFKDSVNDKDFKNHSSFNFNFINHNFYNNNTLLKNKLKHYNEGCVLAPFSYKLNTDKSGVEILKSINKNNILDFNKPTFKEMFLRLKKDWKSKINNEVPFKKPCLYNLIKEDGKYTISDFDDDYNKNMKLYYVVKKLWLSGERNINNFFKVINKYIEFKKNPVVPHVEVKKIKSTNSLFKIT